MKDWFPSKKLIDETALKMREAYRNGYEAEYKLRRNSLLALLYNDAQQSFGAYKNNDKNALYIYFLDLISYDITLKWAKKDDTENQSFTGYFSTTLKLRSGAQVKMGIQGYDIDTIIDRKIKDINSDVPDIEENEEGKEINKTNNTPDDEISIERINDVDRLAVLKTILDKLKIVIDTTRQKKSKVCNRTFASEQIMLDYIPFTCGRLLKQVSNQFEAVTYYSLFGFLMESDIIDPAAVGSIDDIFKCYVPDKYYTEKGNEKEKIPRKDTCEYLKKFHNIEKTPDQLTDNYKSYQKAFTKPDTTTE